MNSNHSNPISNILTFSDLKVVIREIGEEYNNEMLAIMDGAPMESKAIHISTDRHPNVFTIPQFYYDSFKYFGFFVNEELHGFALLAHKQAQVNGIIQTVFHFTDFYLDDSLRRRNLYYLAGPYIYAQLPTDCKIGYGIFIRGNLPVASIVKKTADMMDHVPVTRLVADIKVYSIFLLFKKKRLNQYQIRTATSDDVSQIVELLYQEHQGRLFGKHISTESFIKELDEAPALSLDNYYVALENNIILGVLAIWDTNSFNRVKVVKYGWSFKIVRLFHSLAAKVFKFKVLPNAGGHLKALFIRDIAIKDQDPHIFHALLIHVYNQFRTADYHLIYSGVTKGNPLEQAFGHFQTEVVESNMVLGVLDPVRPDDVVTDNPFVEYGVL